GIWNEAGAIVALEIAPTFVQTKAFVALMATLAACAAWLVLLGARRKKTRVLGAGWGADGRTSSPDEVPPLHAQLADAARQTFAKSGIAAAVEHEGLPRSYPPTVGSQI